MTIRAGDTWGSVVPRPGGLRTVPDDAALAAAVRDGSELPTAVSGGDIARTLGSSVQRPHNDVGEFTIDLVQVVLDDGLRRIMAAHLVARSSWWRGSWWFGPVLAVMNSEFLGVWDVAPRGHPNDGRVETLECDSKLALRQRFAVSRRLAAGTHVPHPAILKKSVRCGRWTFERRVTVFLDGRRVGRSRSVEVTVLPDGATIYR